jgi:sialate O-acetylesterase
MSFKKCFGAAGLVLLLLAITAHANIKPHALISDGMVLQQGQTITLWGTGAGPNEEIAIELTGLEKPVGATCKADKEGKWKAFLPSQAPGGPYALTFKGAGTPIKINDIYIGEVWVCSGQSNMEMRLNGCTNAEEARKKSANEKIRLFTVPFLKESTPQTDVKSKWVECGPNTVGNFSAVAYFFGRDLQKARNVPVGLIHTSVGGTAAEQWTSNQVLHDAFKDLEADGSKLYNGMIAPLRTYPIAGVIWYQGESNAGDSDHQERAEQYGKLFPAMITDWRTAWNQPKLPFLFVQLAPFMKKEAEPTDTPWARLREAQRQTSLKVPNTAMAVITDVGDEKEIHPRQKEPVGARLALAARALAYGETIEYAGPVYDSVKFEDGKAIVSFKKVGGGLIAKDGNLRGFTIAGEDGHFVNAEAVIQGDKVIVSSPKIARPEAVRFGWANYPQVNLWNKDGLPASPFRTDNWPVGGKKK